MVPANIWILVMPSSGTPLAPELLDRCKRLEKQCRYVDEIIDFLKEIEYRENLLSPVARDKARAILMALE